MFYGRALTCQKGFIKRHAKRWHGLVLKFCESMYVLEVEIPSEIMTHVPLCKFTEKCKSHVLELWKSESKKVSKLELLCHQNEDINVA